MICGSCPHTDGLCYTSIPPKVRCNITGEYHYYGDECTCKKDPVELNHERENFKALLARPGALMAINYDSDIAPAVALSGEEVVAAYESLLNLPLYGECEGTTNITVDPKVATFDRDSEAWKITAQVEYGCTSCLACGEPVGTHSVFDNGPKICTSCQNAIQFIRNKQSAISSLVTKHEQALVDQAPGEPMED